MAEKKRNRRGLSLRFLVVIRQHLSDLVRGSVVALAVQDISEPPERFDANYLAALYERAGTDRRQ